MGDLNTLTCKTCGVTTTWTPDRASTSFMHDGHLFSVPPVKTPEEMIEWIAERLPMQDYRNRPREYVRYGMLCPVRVYAGDYKIREIGKCVHTSGTKEGEVEKFLADADKDWLQPLKADPEAYGLICMFLQERLEGVAA